MNIKELSYCIRLRADVIKIENPMRGDDTRTYVMYSSSRDYQGILIDLTGSWNPPSAPTKEDAPLETSHLPPESAYFLSVNRNKRSCTVNFKHLEGLKG